MAGDYKPKKIASIVGAVSEALSMTNAPQQLLDMVLDSLLETMKVDCCWVQRLSANSRKLRLAAYRGFTPVMKREMSSMDLGQKFGNQVAGLGHKIIIPDVSRDREYDLSSFREGGLHSLVAVPLRTYRVQGVVGIASRRRRKFNAETTELLNIIAGMVGMALDKADLYQRVVTSEKQLGTVTKLSVISGSGKGDVHQGLVTELKEAAMEWTVATGEAEKAAEQIDKLTVPEQAAVPQIEETIVSEQEAVPQIDKATIPENTDTLQVDKTTALEKVAVPQPEKQPESPPAPVPEKLRAEKIRVFIVDGQVIFRHVLCKFISQTDDIEVVGESGESIEDTAPAIKELFPNVVLVDANLPSFSGLGLARRITSNSHKMSVILLTPYEYGPLVYEALRTGIAGYLGKDITGERVISTIRRVFNGEHVMEELFVRPTVAQWVMTTLRGIEKKGLINPLFPDEMQVMEYFANGFSCEQVAHIVGVSEQDIASGVASIVSKLVAAGISPDLHAQSLHD